MNPKQPQGKRGGEQQPGTTALEQVEARGKLLYVWDTTAAPGKVRTHEVIAHKSANGQVLTKSYTLASDKAMGMPLEHALQFLRDPAFIVSLTDDIDTREKNRVKPVKARVEQVNVISLSETETIAEWSELSDEALIRRAMVFPSDTKPRADATREELIEFLTEASRSKKRDGDRLSDEGGLEGMGAGELDRLFGGDRQKGIGHNPMAT